MHISFLSGEGEPLGLSDNKDCYLASNLGPEPITIGPHTHVRLSLDIVLPPRGMGRRSHVTAATHVPLPAASSHSHCYCLCRDDPISSTPKPFLPAAKRTHHVRTTSQRRTDSDNVLVWFLIFIFNVRYRSLRLMTAP